jgi:hypothetical protein
LCNPGNYARAAFNNHTKENLPTIIGIVVESGIYAQKVLDKCRIEWLIIYGCTSRSRIFHLYGDVTIAGEGLQFRPILDAQGL